MKRNAERLVEPVIAGVDLSQDVRRGRREFMKGLTPVSGTENQDERHR